MTENGRCEILLTDELTWEKVSWSVPSVNEKIAKFIQNPPPSIKKGATTTKIILTINPPYGGSLIFYGYKFNVLKELISIKLKRAGLI